MNVAPEPAAEPAAGAWLSPIYDPWKGNATEMARDIGELPVTTNQWRYRGFIPDRYREKIIFKAAALGYTLTHRDFIHPDQRIDAPALASIEQ